MYKQSLHSDLTKTHNRCLFVRMSSWAQIVKQSKKNKQRQVKERKRSIETKTMDPMQKSMRISLQLARCQTYPDWYIKNRKLFELQASLIERFSWRKAEITREIHDLMEKMSEERPNQKNKILMNILVQELQHIKGKLLHAMTMTNSLVP